jgi:hypothetical protein
VPIRHISLVGCNLDNPTDNSTSTYAAQILQNLKKIGVTSTSARSDYVAIGPDGRKLTCFLVRAFVAFLTVSLSESCRTILVWYCELLSPKCLPLYLTKVPPTQTTIVQMQKDGTYREVYGTKLDKITGRVKLSGAGNPYFLEILECLCGVGTGAIIIWVV